VDACVLCKRACVLCVLCASGVVFPAEVVVVVLGFIFWRIISSAVVLFFVFASFADPDLTWQVFAPRPVWARQRLARLPERF
jgi:hypothetical protein